MTHKYKVGDQIRMLVDYYSLVKGFELVTEEETAPEQDNKDLTDNRTPLGLLDPDVRKRMEAWEHGHEHYVAGNVWCPVGKARWFDDYTYRAKPAPVEPERVTVWMNVYEEHIGSVKDSRKDADTWGLDDRIALWRITYDKETGLNPVIEVEGEQDE